MAIDWKKVEEDAGSKYKNYAKPGTYKVKCVDVDIREVGTNGSVAQDFIFEEDDNYQYPKAGCFVTNKEGIPNTVNLQNGEIARFYCTAEVTPVKAGVTIFE